MSTLAAPSNHDIGDRDAMRQEPEMKCTEIRKENMKYFVQGLAEVTLASVSLAE